MKTYNRYLNNYTSHTQTGFTLIELMISMVLGLLIILAALALFFGSSKNLRVQDAAADVQEASVFGIRYIKSEVAMTNLGAHTAINQESPWTGVALTASIELKETIPESDPAAARQVGNLRGVFPDPVTSANPLDLDKMLTMSGSNANKPARLDSNVGVVGNATNEIKSDQLTIQYQVPFPMTDCEGNNRVAGDILVERFFTRVDTTKSGKDAYNIVLACDAGWYRLDAPANANLETAASRIAENTFAIHDFGDDGVVLVNRVDYFHIKLGVMLEEGMTYMPISQYMVASTDTATNINTYTVNGPVIAIQMGVLTRGIEPIATETPVIFDVLGDKVEVSENDLKYIRRVYDSTIFLRNGIALGETS